MLISGVHFDFFFSPKEADLQVRRLPKIFYRQSQLRSGEIAKKTNCWLPPTPLGYLSVKATTNYFKIQSIESNLFKYVNDHTCWWWNRKQKLKHHWSSSNGDVCYTSKYLDKSQLNFLLNEYLNFTFYLYFALMLRKWEKSTDHPGFEPRVELKAYKWWNHALPHRNY